MRIFYQLLFVEPIYQYYLKWNLLKGMLAQRQGFIDISIVNMQNAVFKRKSPVSKGKHCVYVVLICILNIYLNWTNDAFYLVKNHNCWISYYFKVSLDRSTHFKMWKRPIFTKSILIVKKYLRWYSTIELYLWMSRRIFG